MQAPVCIHFDARRILVVVPVFNHAGTLPDVVRRVLSLHPNALVVDDGSTDLPFPATGNASGEVFSAVPPEGHPLYGLVSRYLRLPDNRGKGAAVLAGAAEAKRLGMSHIITIDADGQHDPDDLPRFLSAAAREPLTVFVGERDFPAENVPFSSRFGRVFSNFWYRMQTEKTIGDVQSGFRLYPLSIFDAVRCRETRYAFEVEILVRASWAGFSVKGIPVSVRYQPKNKRVSHFKPLADNARIALLNTRLTFRAIMPVPQKKFAPDAEGRISPLHPLRSIRLLLADNATPGSLALGAAVGMGIGTLPLPGLHSLLILFLTGTLRVNKIAGLTASQLCLPPFVPALCIEAGYYLRHDRFLTEISLRTIGYEAFERIGEWILGSLFLCPILACLCGILVGGLAKGAQRVMKGSPPAAGPEQGESSL
ncbi:MAG: DUF2062 domain-containing protein [Desulfovibrio sp.]|jgi:glycosyltransferase involved in cell wall biosynthesis/uncharacterized protein (DUF2062 family)|nr:DUF2062 domain-containing protein [Desulfovibrio sp.]